MVGSKVIESLGQVCGELGLNRAIVATGKRTNEVAGKKAVKILVNSGLEVEKKIVENSDLKNVEIIERRAKKINSDVVIGVGGGKTIDVAKLAAFYSNNLFISMPTAASHDGIANGLASIKGLNKPYSIKAKVPAAVLADSEIISNSPFKFTASGCGDAISKIVSVRDWRLAHEDKGEYYGDYAASLALMSSNLIMRNADIIRKRQEKGYRTLLEALVSCGVAMSIAGSSRPCSGSAHIFSHTLDIMASSSALHGEQCGIGAIMMAKLHGLNWDNVKKSLKKIGAPTTAGEIGISNKTLIKALVKAREIRPDRYTVLNKIKLTEKSAKDLAEKCGVI
jgi:glycerol-1-phosphate dehydrogenase [NAD(P)+]